MKEPYAMLNTHILTVKGYISVDDGEIFHPRKDDIDIRCTSDAHGETLSLTYKNVAMAVKVKDVEKIIKEARDDRRDRA